MVSVVKLSLTVFTCLCGSIAAKAQVMDNPAYRAETWATGVSGPASFVFVAPGKMLITERLSGKVTIWNNGIFSGEALDLPVANAGEEGLLGICTDLNFASNGHVYVFYSEAATDGGSWIGDRVNRYHWNGSTLTFLNTVFSTPFDAGQENQIYHHGGYIKCGPDGKLYIWTGEIIRGRVNNPRIEQNSNSNNPSGAGAIHRVNPDGTIPPDNPFAFHPDPRIKAIWLYGVRNGYGMAFDPLTNNLWFTDNGPDVYDEINLAYPGMNGGWLKIMGPDSRDASYADNGFQVFNASDLVYLSGATYSDPKFSWQRPIGVTSVEFLSSYKFDGPERYKMLIGDVNLNHIYLFSLIGANRTEIDYLAGTTDRVADNPTERDQYRFGRLFGAVTDLRLGPDGLLYVCDLFNGRILRIRPILEPIAVEGISLIHGIYFSGDLGSLLESDNNKYIVRAQKFTNQITPPAQIEFTATSPTATTLDLRVNIESSANDVNIQQRIELFNHITQAYELVDARVLSQTDSTFEISTSGDDSRFIDASTRQLKARLTYRQLGPTFNIVWRAQVDRFWWKVQTQ
ncbi:MAG: PQQ-dependent sugar dehydrogenase [Fimbriimonadales bacterium]